MVRVATFMISLLALSFVLAGCHGSKPQSQAQTVVDGPLIELLRDSFDLGNVNVYNDTERTFDVDITNPGTDTLRINNVEAPCEECTHYELQSYTLAPGESTLMTVVFDGRDYFPQRFDKEIILYSNAVNQPECRVVFYGYLYR